MWYNSGVKQFQPEENRALNDRLIQHPLIPAYRNHYLFSDYYLEHRAAQRREWREGDSQTAFDALVRLWREKQPALPNANEWQTEDDWIKPVLRLLGHRFTVQVSVQVQNGIKTPDYILCSDEISRQAIQALNRPATETDLRPALAVADAKAWDRPLDRTMPAVGVRSLHENPSLQIDTYLRYSGLPWGLLTNGRLWRLYHQTTSKKLDVFYEVDLPALLATGDAETFKYFWLFFRREAFQPGITAPTAPAWLNLVLSESQAYEQGVSDSLQTQVYEALAALAQGFLDFPGNGLQPTVEMLKHIHDNSLIVLYRLCLLYTSPSPRDRTRSRMPSSA